MEPPPMEFEEIVNSMPVGSFVAVMFGCKP